MTQWIDTVARTFWVQRDQDMTGLSGTGIVADGVQFPDGTTVVRWRELGPDTENYKRGVRATTVVFPNVEAVEALHGHNGATHLVWTDDPTGYVDALDAISGSDGEAAHHQADNILRSAVAMEISQAYERLIERADFWSCG